MAVGLYATLTPLPFSMTAATEMAKVLKSLLDLRRSEGRSGDVLYECYAKVADYEELPLSNQSEKKSAPASLGSAWILECSSNHGFHYHTFSSEDPALSFRRLLFIANKGFTAEIVPFDPARNVVLGPLEKYVMDGPSFAELEFDGRMVHRFRPLDKGSLFAYSVHYNDEFDNDHAARLQTHEVSYFQTDNVVEHILKSPRC